MFESLYISHVFPSKKCSVELNAADAKLSNFAADELKGANNDPHHPNRVQRINASSMRVVTVLGCKRTHDRERKSRVERKELFFSAS
jgi:hypothetical protein